MDAVAVALPGGDVWQVAVPYVGGDLREVNAALGTVCVDEAQFDAFGSFRKQREVRTGTVKVGA